MYGTVAHLRVKPGMEERMYELMREFDSTGVPGSVGGYLYKMDSDPNEFYLAVLFESKDAYFANAKSPEQNERFMKMMECVESEPEWHDGEVTYTSHPSWPQESTGISDYPST